MTLNTIAPGANKQNPFTLLILATPGLETPWQSGVFGADPITSSRQAFDNTAHYICDVLFGRLSGQRELGLGSPGIGTNVRVLVHFDASLPVGDATSFVGLNSSSTVIVARRRQIAAFVATLGIEADVVFAVSANASHDRASAWPADDDLSKGGQNFQLDGAPLVSADSPVSRTSER